jgi:hypothetical protein
MADLDVFYGTSAEIGDTIMSGGVFPPSLGSWNWLGTGVYFWIEDSSRALEWANQRAPGHAMVLKTRLRPRRCLDLTQLQWTEFLRRRYAKVAERYARADRQLPVNVGDDHALDCLVINEVCNAAGEHFDSVKATFVEGGLAYPGSAISMKSQIQIAVRDPGIIVKRPRVPFVCQIVSPEEPHG